MDIAKHIDNYIQKKSIKQSYLRGIILYKENRADVIFEDNGDYVLEVEGESDVYEVIIKGVENNKIRTDCDCPYNKGGICKHTVASLLEVKDIYDDDDITDILGDENNDHRENSKQLSLFGNGFEYSPKPGQSKDWFYISNPEKLTVRDINNVSNYGYGNVIYDGHLEIIEKSVNSIRFKLRYHNNFSNYPDITFRYKDNILQTQCTCTKFYNKLCKHQAYILKEFLNSDISSFIDILSNSKYEEAQLIRFGLDNSFNFNEYLTIVYDEGDGFMCIPHKKGMGLIPTDMLKNDSHLNNFFSTNKREIYIDDEEEINNLTELQPAYIIKFDHISPIETRCGKKLKNKDELSKNLKSVDDISYRKEKLVKDSDDKKIINTINYVESITSGNYGFKETISSEEQIEVIDKTKEIFPKLQNKYTYFEILGKNFDKSIYQRVRVSAEEIRLKFRLTINSDLIELVPYFHTQEKDYENLPDYEIIVGNMFVKIKNKVFLQNTPDENSFSRQSVLTNGYKVNKKFEDDFFEKVVKKVALNFEIDFDDNIFKVKEKKLKFKKNRIHLAGHKNDIVIEPIVEYDNAEVNLNDSPTVLEKKGKNITILKRDPQKENILVESLTKHYPELSERKENLYHLSYDEFKKDNRFFDAFEEFSRNKIVVTGYNTLKKIKFAPYRPKFTVNASSANDWFDVEIKLEFGDYTVSLKDLKKSIQKNENVIELGNGTQGIIPEEWLNKLSKYFKHGKIDKNTLKLSKMQFTLVDELFDNIDNEKIQKELDEKKTKILSFKNINKTEVPNNIKAELRDYQKEGLNWLNFLDEFKWGGVLADDMGLGKTIQIITFLEHIKQKVKGVSLIVVPTTLIFNWKNELDKFCPTLKTYFHQGIDREKNIDNFYKYDLIITSYGIMNNDIKMLQSFKFNYVVLDESQAIKNPASQRYKAACLLKADNKIAMTGTPIENNTFDLYAQMNFTNPGLLGSMNMFRDFYSRPIDHDKDKSRASDLQKLIKPFILRRTKEQVAKELPEKTEGIIYCEMEVEQKKVYEAYRNKYRDYLLNKIDEDGMDKSKLYVLEGLTKLRQICDSPEILSDIDKYDSDSIKVKELIRHIKNKTSNHKVLVFSQFVKMLDVIKRELNKEGITYEYLDGQCTAKQRKESVEHFESDASCRVFLISLKAGGTGLNLVSADYVYLVDPWWNPAVEMQAIDRCYRIGQDKHVFAYRMICKDTVEEKITKYQENKRQIASDIIKTDESFMKSLDKNDIAELFS